LVFVPKTGFGYDLANIMPGKLANGGFLANLKDDQEQFLKIDFSFF
jgi:hypothetical protein